MGGRQPCCSLLGAQVDLVQRDQPGLRKDEEAAEVKGEGGAHSALLQTTHGTNLQS